MSQLLARLGRRVSAMPDNSLFRFAQTMSVVLMPSLLPLLRFQFDEPDQRKKLFVRDFTGGWIGMASYYAARFLTNRAGDAFKLQQKMGLTPAKYNTFIYAASVTAGWLGNILYQGIGAVKLSQWMDKRFFNVAGPASKAGPKTVLPAPRFSSSPLANGRVYQQLFTRPRLASTPLPKP